jgi:hypothetical protein
MRGLIDVGDGGNEKGSRKRQIRTDINDLISVYLKPPKNRFSFNETRLSFFERSGPTQLHSLIF